MDILEKTNNMLKSSELDDLSKNYRGNLDMLQTSVGKSMEGFHIVTIGNTGAGKSTTLNSILGESDLIPTNCMRACTSSIVQLK